MTKLLDYLPPSLRLLVLGDCETLSSNDYTVTSYSNLMGAMQKMRISYSSYYGTVGIGIGTINSHSC